MLTSRIRSIHQRSHGTYGAPRIHAELRESGICVGRKRVARLMRMASICEANGSKTPWIWPLASVVPMA